MIAKYKMQESTWAYAGNIRPLAELMVVSAVVFILLLATSPMLPMSWNEGNAILRAENISQWAAKIPQLGVTA